MANIHNNPYISPIMEAVDMMAQDAANERRIYELEMLKREEEGRQQQFAEKQSGLQRKYNFFLEESKNPNLDPETRAQLTEAGLKMLQNPEMEIPNIPVKTMPEKPPAPVFSIPKNIAKYYGIPDIGYSLKDVIDITQKYQDDRRADEDIKRKLKEGGKEEKDRVLKRLKDLRDEAVNRYEKGERTTTQDIITGEEKAYNAPTKRGDYIEYLRKIDELIKKRESGKWTDADQKELDRLQSFDVFREEMDSFRNAKEKGLFDVDLYSTHQKSPSISKDDPLGLKEYLEKKP